MGEEAERALLPVWLEGDSRERARALWLLVQLDGRGAHYVDLALRASDTNLRIVGLRLARRLGLPVIPLVAQIASDTSAQVRREALLALRHAQAPEAAELWAAFAARHDGQDRWYLEALGIAAEGQWSPFLRGLANPGGRRMEYAAGAGHRVAIPRARGHGDARHPAA